MSSQYWEFGIQNHFIEDEIGDRFMMPYDFQTMCDAISSACNSPEGRQEIVFLGSVPSVTGAPTGRGFVFETVANATWLLSGSHQGYPVRPLNWSSADVAEIRFAPGSQIEVDGILNVDGVTLTASGSSWKGIRFEPGASGVLTGGSIDKTSTGSFGYAVVVHDADLTVDGTTIGATSSSGSGLYATGGGADVTITGRTKIRNHSSGYGLYAASGADILVTAGPTISGNASGGVRASGVGSTITVEGGAISNNFGKGASATSGGTVDFSRPSGDAVRVAVNKGGLYGETGAFIGTDGKPNNFPNNGDAGAIFFQNNLDFDAISREFTTVDAEYAWWGTDQRSEISTYTEDGTLDIDPILTSAPSAAFTSAGSAPASAKAGDEEFSLHALIVGAERLRKNGDASGASALLTDALATATTEVERGLLASAALRLLGDSRLDARTVGAASWSAAASRLPGAQQPWALRVQSVAALERGDGPGVREAAEALLQHGPRHAVFAQRLLVRSATAERDESTALRHLAALHALDAESAADVALSVAVAFEGADVSGALQKRGTAPGPREEHDRYGSARALSSPQPERRRGRSRALGARRRDGGQPRGLRCAGPRGRHARRQWSRHYAARCPRRGRARAGRVRRSRGAPR